MPPILNGRGSANELSFKYALFPIAFIVLFCVFTYIENHSTIGYLSIIGIILSAVYVILLMTYVIFLAIAFVRRRLKLAMSLLFGTITLAVLPLAGPALADVVFLSIDQARFFFGERYYYDEVEKRLRGEDPPRVIFLDWGSGGFLTTNFFFSLVYDETGEILLPDQQRTESWKTKAAQQNTLIAVERCKSRVWPLRGQFYSVSTVCQ